MPQLYSITDRILGHKHAFVYAVSIGMLLRLCLTLFNRNAPLEGDALWYSVVADGIANGSVYDAYWPPGLPVWLSLWKWIPGNPKTIVCLSMLPWMWLLWQQLRNAVRTVAGDVLANGMVLLFAIYPIFILQSTEPLSHVPAAALLLLAWNQAQKFKSSGQVAAVWKMGLALGAMVLFRPSGLLLLVLWPVAMGWVGRKKGGGRFQASWLWAWVPALFIVASASGLVSRTQDRPIFLNDANARNFYLGNNAWTPEYKTWYFGSHWAHHPSNPAEFRAELKAIEDLETAEQPAAYWKASRSHFQNDPASFFMRSLSRLRTFLAFDTMAASRLKAKGWTTGAGVALLVDAVIFLLVMALAMAFFFMKLSKESIGIEIGALFLIYALPYFFSFSHPTYHLPLVPILAILAARTWKAYHKEGKRMGRRQKIQFGIALGGLVLIQLEWTIRMSGAWFS